MLHKNADVIDIDLSKITIKEVVLQGQRYQEVRQGRTLLFKGKKSQLPAAQLALAYKVIEAQTRDIKELSDDLSDLQSRDAVVAQQLEDLAAAVKTMSSERKQRSAPKARVNRKQSTKPKKEQTNDLEPTAES